MSDKNNLKNKSEQFNYSLYGSDAYMDRFVDSGKLTDNFYAINSHYGLDRLIDSENHNVRSYVVATIAQHNLAWDTTILNKAIDDEFSGTRKWLAYLGYGLDKLIQDRDIGVRDGVFNYLSEHGCSDLDEWIERNPECCVLPKNVISCQVEELQDKVREADAVYDLSCIDGLYDFSREVWDDFGAEIEFNEGLPIEWCVSAEINEPLKNWRLSKYMDLEFINFDRSNQIVDFCCERYGLEDVSPADLCLLKSQVVGKEERGAGRNSLCEASRNADAAMASDKRDTNERESEIR